MLLDAFHDRFDTALLISGDSDLIPPVKAIRKEFAKRIVVAFPPERSSIDLKNSADAYFTIGRATFKKSLFPETIVKKDGYTLTRPVAWRSNISP